MFRKRRQDVYFQSVPKTLSKKISPVIFDTNVSAQIATLFCNELSIVLLLF